MTGSVLAESLGNLALGVFLGYMAWYFIARNASKALDGLASVAGVVFGAAVLGLLSPDAGLRWLYPLGLVVGWAVWVVMRLRLGDDVAVALTQERTN